MGKGVRKTHSKVKKSNYEVLSLLIPHLRIKCRHGEPVSHTNAMLALSTMFTVIKMFGLLPMFAKMFNTLCKRTPLPHPQSFHCLNPNVVFSPQKGNPGQEEEGVLVAQGVVGHPRGHHQFQQACQNDISSLSSILITIIYTKQCNVFRIKPC